MPSVFFSPRALVVDCGASRTALGAFTRRGRLCLDEFAVETFPATAACEDDWLGRTRAALAALRARRKAGGPVVLILPPHLALTKLITTPPVKTAQREQIIRFEAAQGIPSALADVVWDSVVAGRRGSDLAVLLAAAKLDVVGPLCAAAQAAGFEPRLILPASLATLAAFRLVHPAQTGCTLVLNLGARSTTLLLAEPARFVVRTLAFGGNGVTRQIAAERDCTTGEAEAIKHSDLHTDLTAGAMEALAARLAQEITRSVLHFHRQGDLAQPARVYLTGGGARLAGLAEALAGRLKVSVDRLDAPGVIEIGSGAPHADVASHAPALADLVGAAAAQLWTDQPVINLLPPGLRRQETLRRRQPWLLAAAVLAVAALLPPVLHYRRVADEARRKTAAIERELTPLQERAARNRANLAQLEELRRQVIRLQGLHECRVSWLNLLADLQDRLVRVEDVWLERLQVTPAADGAPLQLHVTGRMLDPTNPPAQVSRETSDRVKALLRDLAGSPYVTVAEEGQRFDSSQPGILRFDLVLTGNPARPL